MIYAHGSIGGWRKREDGHKRPNKVRKDTSGLGIKGKGKGKETEKGVG